MKKLFIALLIIIQGSIVFATDYYIAKTGSDSNTGLSTSAPWLTISKANSTLVAGDTVYIRVGEYSGDDIAPANSGTSGNYITYQAYNDEVVTLVDSYDLADLNNKSYIIIDGLRFYDATHYWIDMESATYCIIRNSYFEKARGWAGLRIIEGANYNTIKGNTLIATCPCTEACEDLGGPADIVNIKDSDHVLVEDNIIIGGTHDAIGVYDRVEGQNYTVIRNNYIQNKMHSNVDIWGIEYILFENNIVVDGGDERTTNWCGSSGDRAMTDLEHKGIMTNTKYAIVRNNTLVDNGMGIDFLTPGDLESESWKVICTENKYYSNTISSNIKGIRHNSVNPSVDNIIKNNIIYDNSSYEIDIYDGSGTSSTNFFLNNNVLGASERYAASDTVTGAISLNPSFVDEGNRDFTLNAESSMIDAGIFLTVTSGSGSGTAITVDDAKYFMDGWDIVTGDIIQLEGQTVTATITSIDYSTNVLTVDTSLTWTDDLGVALPYNGASPDLGAIEYTPPSSAPTFSSATVDGTTVLVNFSEACTRGIGYTDGDIDLDMGVTGDNIPLAYVSGDGTTQWTMTASSSATSNESINLDFNGNTDSIESGTGDDLALLLNGSVTNATTPTITAFSSYYEAEDMTITSPMEIGSDTTALSGGYISVLTGTNSTDPTEEATKVITLSEAGTYYLWLRINGERGERHALYTGIDDIWDRVYPTEHSVYEWNRVEIEHGSGNYGFVLEAGEHTLHIGHGEIEAKADTLYLTTDAGDVPPYPVSNYYEAEDMTIIAPMEVVADVTASGGEYIVMTTGTNSTDPAEEATEEITLLEDGTYYLWLKINGVKGEEHALYAGVNDIWDRVYPSTEENGTFTWLRVETADTTEDYGFDLEAGNHTLRIGHGEINAKADIMFITSDPTEIPTDIDTTSPTIVSATIDGTTVVINFSEACTRGTEYNTLSSDFDIDMSISGNGTAAKYVSGDGTTQWVLTALYSAVYGETIDLDFNGATGSVEDASGNCLEAVVNGTVTNITAQLQAGNSNPPAMCGMSKK